MFLQAGRARETEGDAMRGAANFCDDPASQNRRCVFFSSTELIFRVTRRHALAGKRKINREAAISADSGLSARPQRPALVGGHFWDRGIPEPGRRISWL